MFYLCFCLLVILAILIIYASYGFDSLNEYSYLIEFQTLVLKPDGLFLFSIDKKGSKKSQKD